MKITDPDPDLTEVEKWLIKIVRLNPSEFRFLRRAALEAGNSKKFKAWQHGKKMKFHHRNGKED